MRLSDWRAASPSREAVAAKVNALVDPVLLALGAEPDPSAWVVWAEEPAARYTILVPTPAGLVSCFVRVHIPGEGPRATAKLTRWSRLQLGELAVETQAGHRLISFQVEGTVIRGADAEADRAGRFAVELYAAVDGRPVPPEPPTASRRATRGAKAATPGGRPTAASAKRSAAAPAPKRSSSATTSRRG